MTHIFGLNLEILAIVQGYRSITIVLGSSLGSVMGKTTILLLLSCVVFAKSSPRPQTAQSEESESEDEYGYDYSYSGESEYYDDYVYESSDDPALVVKDEFAKKKCSDFESDGFSCVPFHGCLAGEIITNGATIINIRGLIGGRKKRSIDLGPLDAKCFCGSEICCRHPEYNNVTLEIDPGTLKDVSGDEKCITTTSTTTTTKPTTTVKTTTTIPIVDIATTSKNKTTAVSNKTTNISTPMRVPTPNPNVYSAAETTITSITFEKIILLLSLAKYV